MKKKGGEEKKKRKKKKKRKGMELIKFCMECYDFVWKLLGYGFLDLCMVIGLFHY